MIFLSKRKANQFKLPALQGISLPIDVYSASILCYRPIIIASFDSNTFTTSFLTKAFNTYHSIFAKQMMHVTALIA